VIEEELAQTERAQAGLLAESFACDIMRERTILSAGNAKIRPKFIFASKLCAPEIF